MQMSVYLIYDDYALHLVKRLCCLAEVAAMSDSGKEREKRRLSGREIVERGEQPTRLRI